MSLERQPVTLMERQSYWYRDWENPIEDMAKIAWLKEQDLQGFYVWPVELGGDPEGRVFASSFMTQRLLEWYLCERLNVASGLYDDAVHLFLHGLRDPMTGAPLFGKQLFDTQFWILSEFSAVKMRCEMVTSGYNPALPYEGRGL